jgi:hypothetical protein
MSRGRAAVGNDLSRRLRALEVLPEDVAGATPDESDSVTAALARLQARTLPSV